MITATPDQQAEFEAAALPLMRWLRANYHPFCTVIVSSSRAELVERACCAVDRERLGIAHIPASPTGEEVRRMMFGEWPSPRIETKNNLETP